MKYDYLYLIQKHFKNFPKNKAAQNVLKLICPEDLEYQIATINHSKLLIQFVEGKNEIKKEISISKIGEENLETVKSFCLVWNEKKDISYFFTEIVSPLKNDQAQYSYLEEVVTKDMQIQKAITAIVGEDLKAEKITMGYWIYKYQNLPSDICNKVTDILDDNFSSDYVAECLNKEKKIKEETGFLPDFCKLFAILPIDVVFPNSINSVLLILLMVLFQVLNYYKSH